ncbi:MAG: hypothetical protein JSU86_12370 [Phycisphaerales bacterium]|nr:MAG: hypothetical protein JSU86_12370 [Phycisphaerales bacterium]
MNSELMQRHSWSRRLAALVSMIAVAGMVSFAAAAEYEEEDPSAQKHACCHPVTGYCYEAHIYLSCMYGYIDQGMYTSCRGIQACYMPGDSCINVDGICCDDLGGVPGGSGSSCPPIQACELPDGSCEDLRPWICEGQDGIPLGEDIFCADVGACCLFNYSGGARGPGGECILATWDDCYHGQGRAWMAGFPGRPGTDCTDQSDDDEDTMPNVCDNCPTVWNPEHILVTDCNDDGDTLDPTEDPVDRNGDGHDDFIQCDTDLDGWGNDPLQLNRCDNCPDHANGWLAGPNDQFNCDEDLEGDVCDADIDGDDVDNAEDACDFTPGPLPLANGVDIVRDEIHPLRGTFLADLDGDCDVDGDDLTLLQDSYTDAASCPEADGLCNREVYCTGCGPCDFCCTGFPDN